MGGAAAARSVIEEEVRRQAADLRLVRDSNRAAVQLQAREAAPPDKYADDRAMQLVRDWCQRQKEEVRVVGGRPLVLEGALTAQEVEQARREAEEMRDRGEHDNRVGVVGR